MNPTELIRSMREMAEHIAGAEYTDTAQAMRKAALLLENVTRPPTLNIGDRVIVTELAIAIDPELAYYRNTEMQVESISSEGDVTCTHPVDGPCGFDSCELHKLS
jgi:hypothetical protein